MLSAKIILCNEDFMIYTLIISKKVFNIQNSSKIFLLLILVNFFFFQSFGYSEVDTGNNSYFIIEL